MGKPGGRVKVLTDTDGDGKYDDAKIFLDEVPFPTGVKVWRKGILVTAAPDILYAEDTDGDDKADVRKILYHGFGEGNQQHRVNGLRWGLDNWLHVGNGDSGGQIKSELTGEQVNVGGRDLRIRPDEGKLETTSGNTQFGRERNDWGDWFGNNNSNPIFHYVLDDHYLRRNPHSAPPAVTRHIQAAPGVAPVFPKSRTLARFNDLHTANRFTSACSTMIYRDDLLGAGLLRQLLHLRAGPQPRPPRADHGRWRLFPRRAGRGRKGERVPRLQRQLVPPQHGPDRPRRGDLDQRHVPLRHRASQPGFRRRRRRSSTCGRGTTRGVFTVSIR